MAKEGAEVAEASKKVEEVAEELMRLMQVAGEVAEVADQVAEGAIPIQSATTANKGVTCLQIALTLLHMQMHRLMCIC